jgi:hypothetical protein
MPDTEKKTFEQYLQDGFASTMSIAFPAISGYLKDADKKADVPLHSHCGRFHIHAKSTSAAQVHLKSSSPKAPSERPPLPNLPFQNDAASRWEDASVTKDQETFQCRGIDGKASGQDWVRRLRKEKLFSLLGPRRSLLSGSGQSHVRRQPIARGIFFL